MAREKRKRKKRRFARFVFERCSFRFCDYRKKAKIQDALIMNADKQRKFLKDTNSLHLRKQTHGHQKMKSDCSILKLWMSHITGLQYQKIVLKGYIMVPIWILLKRKNLEE